MALGLLCCRLLAAFEIRSFVLLLLLVYALLSCCPSTFFRQTSPTIANSYSPAPNSSALSPFPFLRRRFSSFLSFSLSLSALVFSFVLPGASPFHPLRLSSIEHTAAQWNTAGAPLKPITPTQIVQKERVSLRGYSSSILKVASTCLHLRLSSAS